MKLWLVPLNGGGYHGSTFVTVPKTGQGINEGRRFICMCIKGGRMGRSDKVSLWCVSLLINTKFRFFI